MWLRILWGAAFLGPMACTTFEDTDGGLQAFEGRPIDDLIGFIGTPDNKESADGKDLVVWNSVQTVAALTAETTYSSGTVSAFGFDGTGSRSGTTTTYVPSTVNYRCTVAVEIDRQGIIREHDFKGNTSACKRYAAALRSLLEADQTNNWIP